MGPPTKQPTSQRVSTCVLVATKVTEQYDLSESERDYLLPSMRTWDLETLHQSFCWETDKLGLVGPDPVFHDFRLIEDGSEASFRYQLYYLLPDEETAYCVVTNSVDSGAVLVYEKNDWFVIAAFGVHDLISRLEKRGFSSWDKLTCQVQTQRQSHDSDCGESDVSDYWNQYDVDSNQQISESAPNSDKKDDTKLFIQGHVARAVRDLSKLYGIPTQEFAVEIFAIVDSGAYQPNPEYESLASYTRSVLENCRHLYLQVGYDPDQFVECIKMALLELDFMVLHKLASPHPHEAN